jgi:hypothetical protein
LLSRVGSFDRKGGGADDFAVCVGGVRLDDVVIDSFAAGSK